MKRYDPQEIEPKWQAVWAKTQLWKTPDKPKQKSYVLDFFPYPSGDGLHVGHPRGYVGSDIYAHWKRFTGHDVLHPMGWDAFGLPAENAAIRKKAHPAENTAKNIDNFRRQLKLFGLSYDWSREVNSSDPEYYKWTQWIFTELFKRGLAYQADGWQWWCPKDKTVLANEQVIDGKCELCDTEVTKKKLKQWFFKITDYADELVDSLEDLDWPEKIKTMQRNWIGRSAGADVKFKTPAGDVTVYTTRPDTLFGATYLVLAPEHELVEKLTSKEQQKKVKAYVEKAKKESDIARTATDKEKTGVFTGSTATNPVNGEEIPIWVADYVLGGYGTGAIMAVPAHDERDFEFAKKFKLPIKQVVKPEENVTLPYIGEGELIDSDTYSGLPSTKAREKITSDLKQKHLGKEQKGYKLRDWLISRQRYWGTPIPIIHCQKCCAQPVPEKDLPVELPTMKDYLPTGDGQGPLGKVKSFVETTCPKCNGKATRDTDTMDAFADSSWYFLRYPNPHLEKAAWDKKQLKDWLPVDTYVGGAEHAVLHLLYARFWTKALADAGYLTFREPFTSLRNQGLIMGPNGKKMSKSRGNVINPDDIIEALGADSLRVFEMFIGPFDQSADWSTQGIEGSYRFLKRVWTLGQGLAEVSPKEKGSSDTIGVTAGNVAVSKAVRQVTRSIERFRFNTAISTLMETLNEFYKLDAAAGTAELEEWKSIFGRYLILLAPFAPHIAEELWRELGHEDSIFTQEWPAFDQSAITDETVTVIVQVNGKVRTNLELDRGASKDDAKAVALAEANVRKFVDGKDIKKVIYVPDRLINLVV